MEEMTTAINARDYSRRRRQLMRMAGEDAILVLPAAPVRIRSRNTHYSYRQDSDFWYLSGFPEPEAVLVLVPGRRDGESLLFCREHDPKRNIWEGHRAGPKEAVDVYGVDAAFPLSELHNIFPGLLKEHPRIFYHFGRDIEFDLSITGWINRSQAKARIELFELDHILHELRLFKDSSEILQMRRAARISAEAHIEAMRATYPGAFEHEIEAVLQYVFRKHGAESAYPPIVGGGKNACILHYVNNDAPLRANDLLLVDAGAELEGYATDITRCFPVSGRYSPEQRAIYALVLEAQHAALAEARPGRSWHALHDAAVVVLTEGFLRLGLLKGTLQENIKSRAYKRFYMHKTGHWIGLDVHDVGEYFVDGEFRKLESGMVLTIEPGVYIAPGSKDVAERWHGIGVRIEDNVAITTDGHDVLTEDTPRSIDQVEALLAAR